MHWILSGFFAVAMLYALLAALYVRLFRTRGEGRGAARFLLVATLLVHGAFFAGLFFRLGFSVLSAAAGSLSLLALALAFGYFVIEWTTGERNMGVFIVPFALGFQIVASVLALGGLAPGDLPRSPLLGLHVATAMIGYCGLSLAAAFAAMHLALYRQIKRRRLGLFFERLPSLGALETMTLRAVQFGLAFLIASLAAGEALFYQRDGHFVLLDPKIALAAATCGVYLSMVLLRGPLALRGKRFALLAVAGFLLILFSAVLSDRFLPSFHHFAGGPPAP